MKATADTSFLVSLYGGDVNTPPARAWMAANGTPLWIPGALRFETENALRLAQFRGQLAPSELQQALAEIAADFTAGILIPCEIPAEMHWAECRRLSAAHTLQLGCRAYDITHVAGAVVLGTDIFLSFDQQQRSLARAAGLPVGP